jgi:hypothetical protein
VGLKIKIMENKENVNVRCVYLSASIVITLINLLFAFFKLGEVEFEVRAMSLTLDYIWGIILIFIVMTRIFNGQHEKKFWCCTSIISFFVIGVLGMILEIEPIQIVVINLPLLAPLLGLLYGR